ncbi:MAG: amidohydrolase family protein [Acidimicrobiia bacterium]
MQMDDMILVSVDDHVVEPPGMFDDHLPDRYRDVAPHVVHKDDGTDVWQFLEIEVPNIGLNAVAGRPREEYGIDPTSFEEIRSGCYDINDRVRDMNANGLLGSMCFPSLPGFAGRLFGALEDRDAARALAQAYNDWHIDEWCGSAPGRFIPLSIPTIWDPQLMAEEIHRVAAKGCHAVTFPENPVPLNLPSLHSDHWDPFWKACSDEGTVVCMHIGSSSKLVMTAPDAPIDVMIVLQPMNIVQAAADLIHSPVWQKFPDLTVALSEGGTGWVPYFLERLDHTYRVHKSWTGADFGDKAPSEFFMERVILCSISDNVGARHARELGTERLTIEVDYPHSDSTWPQTPERLWGEFSGTDLTDAEINQITHENAMRFFRYDPFSVRSRERCTVAALRAEATDVDTTPTPATRPGTRVEREGRVTITDLNPTA